MSKSFFARWQANFWAGLAIVLPAVISVAAMVWIFGRMSDITDTLLIFLPQSLTHKPEGTMYWYWSIVAFLLAIFLVAGVGLVARNYFGRRLIEWFDSALLKIPLLNKIYSAMKQVNDAFSSSNKTAFRTVVLVEYPHPGSYSLGFVTSEESSEMADKLGEELISVFVPTTPNPTGGFLLFFPKDKVTKLNMSVAEGIKYVISLGSIAPPYTPSPRNGKGTPAGSARP